MARKRKSKPKLPQVYIVYEDDGCETYFPVEGARFVPHETLNDELKEALDEGGDRPFKGESFPAIRLTYIMEVLQENGLLEDMLKGCRESQKELLED